MEDSWNFNATEKKVSSRNLCVFFQHVLPSKAIRNEKILETLMVQANSGMYRVQDSYLEACQQNLNERQDSTTAAAKKQLQELDSLDYTFS